MDTTPNLALPYIAPQQAQKHVTHNEALRSLDALVQIGVESRSLTEPPADPAEGERHIVAAGATGSWSGMETCLAALQDGAWTFYSPQAGWLAWVADEAVLLAFDGEAEWVPASLASGALLFGVNTEADTMNRLAVKSDAILFSHDDVTPGSGDQRTIVNKQSSGQTASLLFQNGWSGRAEMGIAGDDDFRIRVSADGAFWSDAMVVDGATGRAHFPSGGVREVLAADRTYHVDPAGDDANDGLTAATPFATIQKAIDIVSALDFGMYNVTIQLADGTHTSGGQFNGPWAGSGSLTVQGNTSNAAAVTISPASGSCFRNGGLVPSRVTLQWMTLAAPPQHCIANVGLGEMRFGNMIFGSCGLHHLFASGPNASIIAAADYSIAGSAQRHINAQQGAAISITGRLVSFTGDATFSGAFAFAFLSGIITANSCTFDLGGHTITGQRYSFDTNSVCYTGQSSEDYFPGDAAGTVSSGGQYA